MRQMAVRGSAADRVGQHLRRACSTASSPASSPTCWSATTCPQRRWCSRSPRPRQSSISSAPSSRSSSCETCRSSSPSTTSAPGSPHWPTSSSLAVGELKLDRSFIKGLSTAEKGRDLALVRSTIELAHSLGLRVVAEGVEDNSALDLLTGLGCDLAQGYLISRPKPPDELELHPHLTPAATPPVAKGRQFPGGARPALTQGRRSRSPLNLPVELLDDQRKDIARTRLPEQDVEVGHPRKLAERVIAGPVAVEVLKRPPLRDRQEQPVRGSLPGENANRASVSRSRARPGFPAAAATCPWARSRRSAAPARSGAAARTGRNRTRAKPTRASRDRGSRGARGCPDRRRTCSSRTGRPRCRNRGRGSGAPSSPPRWQPPTGRARPTAHRAHSAGLTTAARTRGA